MSSYGQPFRYRCGRCGHDGSQQVWLVADAAERPDLVALVRTGRMRRFSCAACVAPVQIDASLLIGRPDGIPPLLFSPGAGATPEQTNDQLRFSIMQLAQGWNGPFPMSADALVVLPLEVLEVAIDRDVQADLQALAAGRLGAPSANLQRYVDWLGGLLERQWHDAARIAMVELLQGDGPDAWRRTVEANPILLDERVDELLTHMVEVTAQAQPEQVGVVRHRRLLLRLCRRLGVAGAFDARPRGSGVRLGDQTLDPAVGAATLAAAGITPGVREPLSPEDRRELFELALQPIGEREADFAVEVHAGEYVALRHLFVRELADELLTHPRWPADVQEAARLYAQLDGLRPAAPRYWAEVQHNTGAALTRLVAQGREHDPDLARAAFERSLGVRTASADPQGWAQTTISLAELLRQAYPRHQREYLEEAIAVLDSALREAPAGLSAGARARLVMTLAATLVRRSEATGLPDLDRGIELLEPLVGDASNAADAELLALARTNLGSALGQRAEITGQPRDWDRAVAVLRAALESFDPAKQPVHWVRSAGNLGIALRHRTGGRSTRDVADAVDLFRLCIDRAAAAGAWDLWPAAQNNLGNALLARPDGDRDENVEGAIAAFEQARTVWTREAFPVEWALTTGRLARALQELRGDAGQAARRRAADLYDEAVATSSRDERPAEWARLMNLRASAHAALEPDDGDGSELRAAVAMHREAAQVLEPNSRPHDWATVQHNIGTRLRALARITGEPDDARASVEAFEAALAARPAAEAPVEWAQTATSLAGVLAKVGQPLDAVERYRAALVVLEDGGPAADLVRTASRLGTLLAELDRWAEAVPPFRTALAAADRIYRAGLLRRSRVETLGEHSWLTGAAAWTMAMAGQAEEAVATLEGGRALLLVEALDRDPDMMLPLRESRPTEYRAYVDAVAELARAEAAATLLTLEQDPGEFHRRAEREVRDAVRRANAEYDAARRALLPDGAEPTRPSVATQPDHPVVYLLASRPSSMALITTSDGVEVVGPTGPGGDELARMLRGSDDGGGLQVLQTADVAFGAALDDCLRVLGAGIVGSLAVALHRHGATAVTLIPCGLFAALPVHAARYLHEAAWRCLVDDFVVSYAPSAAVLVAARRASEARAGPTGRAVGVVDPTGSLRFAGCEVASLLDRLEGAALTSPTTSRDEVLAALDGATHVHFACHGQSVVDEPLRSNLVLGGGERLALVDLLTSPSADGRPPTLERLRLVVASACQTAQVDTSRTPEEFVGLPAGFLVAGVPGFLGTLWPVGDLPSALLMTRFYELLLPDPPTAGLTADAALRGAQRWLRDLDGRALAAFLQAHPAVAEVATREIAFVDRYPEQHFFEDPATWAAHVFIGAASPPPRAAEAGT